MGTLRSTKRTANQYWIDILFQIKPTNVIPLPGPTYLWDARLTDTLTFVDGNVDVWTDYYQNFPLDLYFGEDPSKNPSYVDSTLVFNGVSNYLANSFNEPNPEFTFMIITGNFSDNLANNPGTFAWIDMDSAFVAMQYFDGQIGLTLGDSTLLAVFASQPNQVIIFQSTDGGTTVNVFQNGGTPSQTTGLSLGSGLQFLDVGAFLGDQYLAGTVSWVAYWNTAISPDEVNTALDYISNNFNIVTTPIS
jgi:hypothetical protein